MFLKLILIGLAGQHFLRRFRKGGKYLTSNRFWQQFCCSGDTLVWRTSSNSWRLIDWLIRALINTVNPSLWVCTCGNRYQPSNTSVIINAPPTGLCSVLHRHFNSSLNDFTEVKSVFIFLIMSPSLQFWGHRHHVNTVSCISRDLHGLNVVTQNPWLKRLSLYAYFVHCC